MIAGHELEDERVVDSLDAFVAHLRSELLPLLDVEDSLLATLDGEHAARLRRDHVRLRSAVSTFERWLSGDAVPSRIEREAAIRSFLVQLQRHRRVEEMSGIGALKR